MTLPQIEREAGKVKTSMKKIILNSLLDRLTDFIFLALFTLIVVGLYRNFNRIDQNFKIIAEKTNIKYESEEVYMYGKNWTTNFCGGLLREKITLKDQ